MSIFFEVPHCTLSGNSLAFDETVFDEAQNLQINTSSAESFVLDQLIIQSNKSFINHLDPCHPFSICFNMMEHIIIAHLLNYSKNLFSQR